MFLLLTFGDGCVPVVIENGIEIVPAAPHNHDGRIALTGTELPGQER